MNRTKLQKWKAAVYWFSIIFLGVGGMVIAIGVWASLKSELENLVSVVPFSFIVIGSFVFLVSFMGWYSSTKENRNLLLVYSVMLFISLAVILGLSLGTFIADIRSVDEMLYEGWKSEYEKPDGAYSEVLMDVEREFSCCGFYNFTNMPVPPYSCEQIIPGAADGCYEILKEELTYSLMVVFIVGLTAAFVQCVGMIFSVLAYKEAPTRREMESLLQEEARKLDQSWHSTNQTEHSYEE